MANRVAQHQIVGIRKSEVVGEASLRIRIQVEASTNPADLPAGWYTISIPVGYRAYDPVQNGTMSPDEIMQMDFSTREERAAALQAWEEAQG